MTALDRSLQTQGRVNMAASDEWTDWHLTPSGWVKGSQETDYSTTEKVTPEDAVLTMRWHVYQGSAHGRTQRYHEETWAVADRSLIDKLQSQHGEAPKRL